MKNLTGILFYTGLAGLTLFEILNVYFIMPFPGSQEIDSLNGAYFLYTHRWIFRAFFGILAVAGSTALLLVLGVVLLVTSMSKSRRGQ